MSKATQQLNESYDRVIKKFNEIDQSFDTTERLIMGLYVLIPATFLLGWFF
jgi:hypothetical protein